MWEENDKKGGGSDCSIKHELEPYFVFQSLWTL